MRHSAVLLLLLCCLLHCAAGCSVVYRGASGCDDGTHAAAVSVMGATHMRVYLHWRYVQPKLMTVLANMTVANVAANPAMIDEWGSSKDVNWAIHDHRVSEGLVHGLKLIGEVGEGTLDSLPDLADGSRADPKKLGKECYLGYMYLTTRAIVRRFAQNITFWQLENELNEAHFAGLGGQRVMHVINDPWSDFDFLTEILKTLKMAVLAEQPHGLVTQNLHTDLSKKTHEKYKMPGFYLDAALAWDSIIDVWSIDGYPNYFGAFPVYGNVIGDRIAAMKKLFPNKDVFVMETGYPVLNDTTNVPADIVDYTEERQALYAQQVWNSTRAAGGCGFLYFTVRKSPGLATPPGGWSKADVSFIEELAKQELGADLISMIGWIASHPLELKRVGGLLKYGTAWGSIRADGTPRPMMAALNAVWKET